MFVVWRYLSACTCFLCIYDSYTTCSHFFHTAVSSIVYTCQKLHAHIMFYQLCKCYLILTCKVKLFFNRKYMTIDSFIRSREVGGTQGLMNKFPFILSLSYKCYILLHMSTVQMVDTFLHTRISDTLQG